MRDADPILRLELGSECVGTMLFSPVLARSAQGTVLNATSLELNNRMLTMFKPLNYKGGPLKIGLRSYKECSALKPVPRKYDFINESELLKHFNKHGGEFKGVYKTPEEYLQGANFVIENGHVVKYLYDLKIRTGYVRFMGNTRSGKAKFEFLALRDDGSIATYHTQRRENFYKTLNQNKANDCVNVEHLSCSMM